MSATTCPNCGPYECYHICPNSPHFYSPEQERYDEANYDPSEYYREGGFYDDLDAMADADEAECAARDEIGSTALTDEVAAEIFRITPSDPDDIPF